MSTINNRYKREPSAIFRGTSAKQLSVDVLETSQERSMCSHVEHANYLGARVVLLSTVDDTRLTHTGRELQKAEFALLLGLDYVQD